jgi:rhamnulokinase
MEQKKYFFAVDLGATSGRTIVGSLSDGKFDLEELTRFDNNLIETGGHFYWDIYALYFEIIKGLKLVAQRGIHIQSIGIDTWGCDFVYVDKNGDILRNPMAYRDPHTVGMMKKYFDEKISKEKVYEKTGIQFMNFNSLFQMYAMRKAGNVALENADKILFIPDALSYMLTGNAICEYTVASTSQILNPVTGDLDIDLVESLGLKREQFGKMTHPATIIGTLTEEIQTIQEIAQELGISYSSFRKLFKEHTGFAPALYQQNLKLQRAKELLSTTDESIKGIAYRLNFESPDYFSAKFKNQTGMKPSDFRNMTR